MIGDILEAGMPGYQPSLRNVFDALTSDSSADGCDPDWRAAVLEKASPEHIKAVRGALSLGEPEGEVAIRLGI